MATLNGNNVYLEFNGTNISGFWTDEIDFNRSNSTVDVTAGAGATDVERNAGLNDTEMSFAVVYDDTDLATYRAILEPGTKGTLIFGPEGNVSGKPKHQQVMILSEVSGPNNTIAKDKVMFELSFEGAAAPTATIAGGSTF